MGMSSASDRVPVRELSMWNGSPMHEYLRRCLSISQVSRTKKIIVGGTADLVLFMSFVYRCILLGGCGGAGMSYRG